MEKFRQLADQSRIALQRLEKGSDTAPALFQADTALMPHDCSALNDLFRPLTLSDDPGLRRGVAARTGVDAPAPLIVTRTPSRRSPVPPGELHQGDQPVREHQLLRQTVPALPADCDSPHSRQLVQNLLDGVRQEMGAGPTQTVTRRRTGLFDHFLADQDNKGLPSPPTTSAGSSRSSGLVADQAQKAAPPFPVTSPESVTVSWFARHPRSLPAAACLLPMDSRQGIPAHTLKQWAAPQLQDKERHDGHALPQETKSAAAAADPFALLLSKAGRQGTADRAGATGPPNSLPAATPDNRRTNTPLQPESTRPFHQENQKTAPSVKPFQPLEPSRQLEQLVRRWQQGRVQTNTEEGVQVAAGSDSSTAPGLFSEIQGFSRDSGEGETLAGALQGFHDSDHAFTETLAWVLQREIRRHGMEEER